MLGLDLGDQQLGGAVDFFCAAAQEVDADNAEATQCSLDPAGSSGKPALPRLMTSWKEP